MPAEIVIPGEENAAIAGELFRIPLADARGSEAPIPSRNREGAVVNSHCTRYAWRMI